jgi:hypothetical protein
MNPFVLEGVHATVETGAGERQQFLTKIELKIDEYKYTLMANVNEGSTCLLGLDILKYYTFTLDGNNAGVLIKNSLMPNIEEEIRL